MKNKIKSINLSTWTFIIEIMIMLLVCIVHSFYFGHYANFAPINGTFQNYNPVRRLLDGQIPYRDFQDYLGLGHLYSGTIVTFLFGGSYRVSLIAFSFLTCLSYSLLSTALGHAIFKKKELVMAATNALLSYRIIKDALYTGNSARYIRGMILPIVCLLFFLAYQIYKKIAKKSPWLRNNKETLMYIGIGIIGGFAFAWSNDYGISCWVCLIVMTFWISFARDRSFIKIVKNLTIELLSSILGLFVTVEIATLGNFTNWLTATFGTGGYQSWYYNSEQKSYYIYNIDLSKEMLVQAGICIIYMLIIFFKKGTLKSLFRYGIPAFCNMVCFCAVNEYKLLSGGMAREVALSTLTFTVLFEIIFGGFRLVSKIDKYKLAEKMFIFCSIGLATAWAGSNAIDEITFYKGEKAGVYIEELDGNLTLLGEDILKTDDFLNGKNFFATYASAQEVVSDTFQPSGTDYIIHVLGDSQRENYLNALKTADFSYVATMKDTEMDWECWIQRVNWFFYRELYENWHPVYANSYELYWERNEVSSENVINNQFNVGIIDIDDSTKKLVIETDSFINGIADVYIDYAVQKKDTDDALFIFQTMLYVKNTGTTYTSSNLLDSNFLRAQSHEYIPIQIVNGYGEATISSRPNKDTTVLINDVSCQRIFTCTFDYLQIKEISTESPNTTLVSISNTKKNKVASADASKVKIQNINYHVDEIMYDEKFITFRINTIVEYEDNQNNIIKILR